MSGKVGMGGKVADEVARVLVAHGVRYAFGIPGNDVLELVRACEEQGITFVLAKSEPSAAFMADAVYQTTGAPALVIAAMGPGLANMITGVAGALMERSAMLILSGDIGANMAGIYNHQVFDHVALARPVVKHADHLNPNRAAQQVARALDIATAYPQGPVLLNVAADASRAPADRADDYGPARILPTGLTPAAAGRLRGMLEVAERPLALIGRNGLLDDMRPALTAFLEGWRMPFLASYKAKGLVSEDHPLCAGAVGLSPVVDAENFKLLAEADRLVLIGFDPIELRDAWVDAWPESTPVLTIDQGPQTHRVFPVGDQALGDMSTIVAQLTPDAARAETGLAEPLSRLKQTVTHLLRPRDPADAISPAALFAAISDAMTPDWWLSVDVGAHRILACHVIQCLSPGQLLQSNGLCSMGYALPAAIGARLCYPDRPVVAIMGDGGALMALGELAVAMERELPLVVVILNDAALALIKLKQGKMGLARRAVDFGAVAFDQLAAGFGAHGVRVTDIDGFRQALDDGVKRSGLTLINAIIDDSEYGEQM